MTTARIAELKARLSEYLRRVRAGDEILVTDRNVPVARIVPIQAWETTEDLGDLQRDGLARPGSKGLPKNFWQLPRGRDSRGTVRSAVDEERSDDR